MPAIDVEECLASFSEAHLTEREVTGRAVESFMPANAVSSMSLSLSLPLSRPSVCVGLVVP